MADGASMEPYLALTDRLVDVARPGRLTRQAKPAEFVQDTAGMLQIDP